MPGEPASPRNIDRFREGPVRLLGYVNELGESFRPLVPRLAVHASYVVSGAYVCVDAAWRSTMPPAGRSPVVEGKRPPLECAKIPLHLRKLRQRHPLARDLLARPLLQDTLLDMAHLLPLSESPHRLSPCIVAAADTLLWQGLASVAIPGFVINRIVWAAGRASPLSMRAWLPTALGLASIPLIVHPIDHTIERFMDLAIRPIYGGPTAHKKDG